MMTDDSIRAIRQWLAAGSLVEEGVCSLFSVLSYLFLVVTHKRTGSFLFQSLYTLHMRWTMTGACLCCSPIRQIETLLSPGALVRTLITEMITHLNTYDSSRKLARNETIETNSSHYARPRS